MSMLKKDITRKKLINKLLELKQELDLEINKRYKVKAICNSKVYAKETTS